MTSKWYKRIVADLKLAGYSERTCKSYARAVRQLTDFTHKAPEEITEEDLRGYWLYCKEDLEWRSASMRISYSGIKFFFQRTVKRDWEILREVHFQRDQTLPVVLNIDEVRKILEAFTTPQNHAFYALVYGCGLRLNEAIHLQVPDIDSQRGLIHIHRGKGAKDRYVPLPDTTLEILRNWWLMHRNPVWLFPAPGRSGQEGRRAQRPVSETTVQGALRRAVRAAGIRKQVVTHTFRHSYATHMIEAGVPVRHVQECLGHSSLATVMIYLHITTHGREDANKRINQLMRGVLA